MDRLQQIATEIIRLYRRQLNIRMLGKLDLKDTEDRRRLRIEELRKELEGMFQAREARAGQRLEWVAGIEGCCLRYVAATWLQAR